MAHVEQDGLFAYDSMYKRSRAEQLEADAPTTLHTKVDIVNNGATPVTVCVSFNLTAPDGSGTGVASSDTLKLAPGQSGTAMANISVTSPSLWSSSTPNLYVDYIHLY